MVKTRKHNKKKMIRISDKMGKKILIMKKNNFTLREIGRALNLTFPAVFYFLKGRFKEKK